jgi:two-component system cell cycle response regulator
MAGDEVLTAVAQTLKKRIRSSDILGRYGGEEFVIVLASVDADRALTVAEAIRRSVAELRVEHGGTSIPITVSVGVAVSGEVTSELTLETLLVQADRALYRAKREGRNRVACWTRGLDA